MLSPLTGKRSNSVNALYQPPHTRESHLCLSDDMPNAHRKKDAFLDECGYISAGGILFYDNEGIWMISESCSKGINFTDFGGRYSKDDCDIYQTISRELFEESYTTIDIPRKDLLTILFKNPSPLLNDKSETNVGVHKVYVHGHDNQPAYKCFIVHTNLMKGYNIDISTETFEEGRNYTITKNPNTPSRHYKVCGLYHIPFERIKDIELSYRMNKIIKHSFLKKYIK